MKKILFLDFDGVLHPATGNSVEEFSKADALACALLGYDCEIVISSAWRLHCRLDQLKDFLPDGIAERVIGTTGDDPLSHYARHDAILAWLASSEPVDWRALDDAKTEFRETSRLIACNPEVGLAESQIAKLRTWLELALLTDGYANMNLTSFTAQPLRPQAFQDYQPPEMVVLPRGQFVMGTGTGEEVELFIALGKDIVREEMLDEQPAHVVRIDHDLSMARYCVTFDEYDAYCRATGAPFPDDEGRGRGNIPVVNVTWQNAMNFSRWLAKITGKPYRLPSEAEWEYAARAGTTTDYWWGNIPEISSANYIETPGYGPFPVASLGPNSWGLYNMHGNVSEWVEDCFHESYFGAPTDGSAWVTDYTWTDPAEDWVRVLRGGDYVSNANEMRSSYRGRVDSSYSGPNIGFRVALTLPKP